MPTWIHQLWEIILDCNKKLGSANENNVKIYEFYLYGDKVIESDKIASRFS